MTWNVESKDPKLSSHATGKAERVKRAQEGNGTGGVKMGNRVRKGGEKYFY